MPPKNVFKSTATEHASSSKSSVAEHAGSTSGAKDSRLENIFQEACANASPKICGLLQEVSALGHYPKRYKQPQNKEERDSNSLAKKLTQARSSLHPAVEKYLEAMKAILEALQAESIATERAKKAEGLMQQVRALGRMPKEESRSQRGPLGTRFAQGTCRWVHDLL